MLATVRSSASRPPGRRLPAALPIAALAALLAGCAARGTGASSPGAGNLEEDRPAGPSGTVSGLVRDLADGSPLALAEVRALPGSGGAPASATSDAAGRFELHLAPGRYRITARVGELTTEAPDVVVLEGRVTALRLELDSRPAPAPRSGVTTGEAAATGEIAGRVIESPSTEPFPGAVIAAVSPVMRDAQTAISDERGGYRLRGLRPGSYDLTVYYQLIDRGAIELRQTDITVRAGEVTRIDLELDLRVQR